MKGREEKAACPADSSMSNSIGKHVSSTPINSSVIITVGGEVRGFEQVIR